MSNQPKGADTAPARIFLQVCQEEDCDQPFAWHEGVTWCQDKINDTDVEYVRAAPKEADTLTAYSDAVLGAAYRSVASPGYDKCYASLLMAHVLERAYALGGGSTGTSEPVATVVDLGKVEFHSVVPIGTQLFAAPEGAGTSEQELLIEQLRIDLDLANRNAAAAWERLAAVAPEPARLTIEVLAAHLADKFKLSIDHATRAAKEYGIAAIERDFGPIYAAPPAVVGARPSPAVVGEPARKALEMFTRCAIPVSTEIEPSGHSWSIAYLDQVLPLALAALGESPLVFPDAGERKQPDVDLTERAGKKPEAAGGQG